MQGVIKPSVIIYHCNFPDIQQIHKLIKSHFGSWAIKQLFSFFQGGRKWIGVDLEVRRQRVIEKKGCVFDHQRLLLSQTSRQTHTLAFISPRSLLEVIGKVEVKWAWIKFDQTVLWGWVCVYWGYCLLTEAKCSLCKHTHTQAHTDIHTHICKF